jgi:hypothetical protein
MITIRKGVISRVWPDRRQAPAPDEDSSAGRLRDLALRLAAQRDLRVSVITYEDGRAELEVLHAGPPHPTAETIGRERLAVPDRAVPGWVVSLAAERGLEDVADLVCATLRDEGA